MSPWRRQGIAMAPPPPATSSDPQGAQKAEKRRKEKKKPTKPGFHVRFLLSPTAGGNGGGGLTHQLNGLLNKTKEKKTEKILG